MKRIVVLVLAAAAVAAFAFPATAAGPPVERRVAALERQLGLLQEQVRNLKAQARILRETVDSSTEVLREELARNRVVDACMALATADVFQSTWTNVDGRVPSGVPFGPQHPLDDVACSPAGVARPGLTGRVDVGVFWSIVAALIG